MNMRFNCKYAAECTFNICFINVQFKTDRNNRQLTDTLTIQTTKMKQKLNKIFRQQKQK